MTPAEQAAVDYLRQPQAIRDRTHQLFDHCQADRLEHFACDLSQLEAVAAYVIETTQQQKIIRVTQGHQDFDTELSAESSCVHTKSTVMSKTQCHYPLVI